MKHLLHIALLMALLLGGVGRSWGQGFTGSETSWSQNWNTDPGIDCASSGYVGNMDNNTFVNTNFNSAPAYSGTERAVVIYSSSTIMANSMPGWNGFLYNDGVYCNFIRNIGGVDISGPGQGKISFVAKASDNGAVLRLYLGSAGNADWYPASSTYNTGSGASIIADFTLSDAYATYTFDYEAADPVTWAAWGGKSSVNQWGFDPQTSNANYFIQKIELGNYVTGTIAANNNAIGIYPNPATTEVIIDFIGMEQQGAVAKLINASGAVLFEGAIGTTFSVAAYPKGLYMLQVTSGNTVASKKLVIQ